MELFKYTPTPYVNTQQDLPLDFLQGQLETKQKEFDAQSAATDKAAENFLKITPGMLTKDAYDRVKNQYLPQIEKIRDTLHQTGNISQAAPDLSKFTMNLAADPEVKNIMQDYELTKTHNQAMQEGRYTKLMLPGLFNKEGQQRAQVGLGQTVQSSWYAPYEHVDPVQALLPEVEKLRAKINEGTYSWYNPATGETVTDRTKLKILEPEIIDQYVESRKDAFLSSPESRGYVIGATDWGTRAYTNEDWLKDARIPLRKFSISEQESERTTKPGPTIAAPTSNKTDGAGNTVTPNQTKALAFTNGANAYVPQVSSFINPEVPITSQLELDDEIKQGTNQLVPLVTAVYQMTGVNTQGRDLNALIQDSGLRQQARDNWNAKYVKNDQGHYIPKMIRDAQGNLVPAAPNVTPQQEQAFEQWNSLITSIDSAKNLREDIKKQAGVDNYNPELIKKAEITANRSNYKLEEELHALYEDRSVGNVNFTDDEFNSMASKSPKQIIEWINSKRGFEKITKEETTAIIADVNKTIKDELKETPEGKIYKVWEDLNTRMEDMQLVNFENDKSTESIIGHLVEDIKSGTIKAKDFTSDRRLDKGKLDDDFTAHIPINKTTGLPDYSQIHLAMAFDRKDGLVGIVSMNGKKFEIDISKDASSNLDKILIEAHPELKEPTKFFHQVYQSLNQTSGRKGKFNLGANTFVFDHKAENLGKGAPKFEYEYDFDGTGKKRTTNLYEIYSAAAGVNTKSVQSNSLQSALTAQQITSEYTRMVSAAGMDKKKIQEATNWYYQKQDEALKEQLAREKASVGKTMGKQQPQGQQDPLGIRR